MKVKENLPFTSELAEIIGIMLGDGGLYLDRLNKYQLTVALNKNEEEYLYYVKRMFENYFRLYSFCISELSYEYLLRNNSVFVGEQLIKKGLKSGNKINNGSDVPEWISSNRKFALRCLRGLFDTDGSIYRKYGSYAQIQIKLASKQLILSTHNLFLILGYHPTKIQQEVRKGKIAWKFYLSRQKQIERFFREIKPANYKHIKRYNKIKDGAAGTFKPKALLKDL